MSYYTEKREILANWLTPEERSHLLRALECIRHSGDKELDRMTSNLEGLLR